MQLKIAINPKIYHVDSIFSACYSFLDKTYIFLDQNHPHDHITISIKPKHKISKKQLSVLRDEFMNELLHCALRYKISKDNKKIREYIISRALYSALPDTNEKFESYQDDPLGIAIPWEEKYGKKKNAGVKV